MRRIIFFSGGVESSAMLTMAAPEDIILVFKNPFGIEYDYYRKNNLLKIANHFNLNIRFIEHTLPVTNPKWVHRLWYILPTTIALAKSLGDISEVWYGLNNEDLSLPTMESIFKVAENVWKLACPDIPFIYPLKHLTKLQQYNLIPEHVKPLVMSCASPTERNCGKCKKCDEFQKLVLDKLT